MTYDDLILSNTSVGGKRLTWRELVELQEEELTRLRAFANLVSDLDRCRHGRHSSDDCFGCSGRSQGNPFRQGAEGRELVEDEDGAPYPDGTLGFTIDGTPIVDPRPQTRRHLPEEWIWRPEDGER